MSWFYEGREDEDAGTMESLEDALHDLDEALDEMDAMEAFMDESMDEGLRNGMKMVFGVMRKVGRAAMTTANAVSTHGVSGGLSRQALGGVAKWARRGAKTPVQRKRFNQEFKKDIGHIHQADPRQKDKPGYEVVESLEDALELFAATQVVAEAKAQKRKGVDGMIDRARSKGWAGGGGNPWHRGTGPRPSGDGPGSHPGGAGQFMPRDGSKSASTDKGTGPKFNGEMGSGDSPAPGKQVSHDCGRHARTKKMDQRCSDNKATPKAMNSVTPRKASDED